MKDDALVEEHVRLHKIKHEPTKEGFLQASYLCIRIWVSHISLLYSTHTTNDFNLHPPQDTETLSKRS